MKFALILISVISLWPLSLFAQSPLKGKVIFSSNRKDNIEIYLLNLESGQQTQITNRNSGMPDYAPAFTPPGDSFTLISYRKGGWRSWIMNRDGGTPRYVTQYNNYNGSARFSKDGKRLVFNSYRPAYELYVSNSDGSNQKKLIPGPKGWDTMADWSPNGQTIIFCSKRSGILQIHQVGSNGKNLKQLTHGTQRNSAPSYSPDGSKITFTSWINGIPEISIMSADGSNQQTLTNHGKSKPRINGFIDNDIVSGWDNIVSTWSPDGQWIIYSGFAGNHVELFVMKPDGSGKRQITFDQGFNSYPSWTYK